MSKWIRADMASRAVQKMNAALAGGVGASNNSDTSARFVHLHVHSAFSLLEGALPLKKVMDLAIADNQPALAITDRNNMFGALEFAEKAAKEHAIYRKLLQENGAEVHTIKEILPFLIKS